MKKYFFHLLYTLAVLSFTSLTSTVFPSDPKDLPSEKIYQEMYKASVLRGITYSKELDPDESVREEIFIEDYLAKIASDLPLAKNKSLQADIDYYQSQQILNDWLNHQITIPYPKEEELKKIYEETKENYHQPATITFQHIFFMVSNKQTEENNKLKLAKKVISQFKRGRSFDQLAREFSELEAANENAGKVGPISLEKLPDQLKKQLSELAPGDISTPIRTPFGWEVILVVDKTKEKITPFEDVKAILSQNLIDKQVNKAQPPVIERIKESFPAVVHEDQLSEGETYQPNKVIAEINDEKYTQEQVVYSIDATYAHKEIKDKLERIKAGLDRFILTKQIIADAEKNNFLVNEPMRTKLNLIRNRLLAERYFKTDTFSLDPSDEELESYYNENKKQFRAPNEYKGFKLTWNIDGIEELTEGEAVFERIKLIEKIEEYIKSFQAGELTIKEFKDKANDLLIIDWTREGPSGYSVDTAFNSTEINSFSKPFRTKSGLAVVYVEGKKEGTPQPFESCKNRVLGAYLAKAKEEKRQALIEEALKAYAQSQSDL